ncbi:protein-tyrosine phosphatase [Enterococcus sp. PF1-24]|uniref:tyrosine-protein phosphatase n=1 Tax=unclassified Enterococcus TaxID=2608891 RepID=UPI002474C374|nr:MULTISPECIES: tyrosine-protein phosphatase [unclassified Enterococcus]MDH6364324.1 protein-tyrosine phosphatase [Enterococcus sp. PFB1-1]MDH6401487.1 protein-tyrosine phosphatase [Enterococcus sp. PF1-24]
MTKIFEKQGKLVIEDAEIPDNAEITVFRGEQPTLTVANKELVGTFTGNTLEFAKSAADEEFRQYYVYQYAEITKIVALRNLSLAGTFNTRDLGGYQTKTGQTVKWGQVFRSDALYQLTDQDVKDLERMNLRTVVDFRGENEIADAPDREIAGVNYVYLNPNAEVAALATGNLVDDQEKVSKLVAIANSPEGPAYFASRLDEMALQMRELVSTEIANKQYRRFLELLLEEDSTPLLEHCKGGKDRAGFAAIVFLMALGVSKEVILQDYLLTKENMQQRNVKRMDEYRVYTDHPDVLNYLSGLMDTKALYFEAAFDEMEKLGGADKFLTKVLGISEEQIMALQQKFLY